MAAARARGRTGGRKPKLTTQQVQLAQQLYDAGEKTVAQIAAIFTVPRTTIYGHLNNGSAGARPTSPQARGHRDHRDHQGRRRSSAVGHCS